MSHCRLPRFSVELRGDLGILREDAFKTRQCVYWSNKATSIVSDAPSEARLTPQFWGHFDSSNVAASLISQNGGHSGLCRRSPETESNAFDVGC